MGTADTSLCSGGLGACGEVASLERGQKNGKKLRSDTAALVQQQEYEDNVAWNPAGSLAGFPPRFLHLKTSGEIPKLALPGGGGL